MLLIKSTSNSLKIDDVICSALISQIHQDCKKFVKGLNLYSDCLLSSHKDFRKSYLIGLKSYDILLYNNFLQVVLRHDNFVKQFDFPVRDIPSYHERLVMQAKENFSKRHCKDLSFIDKLFSDFANELKKLL